MEVQRVAHGETIGVDGATYRLGDHPASAVGLQWQWTATGAVVYTEKSQNQGELRDAGAADMFIGVSDHAAHFLVMTDKAGVLYYAAPRSELKVEPRVKKSFLSNQVVDHKVSHIPMFVALVKDMWAFFDDRDQRLDEPSFAGERVPLDQIGQRLGRSFNP